MSSKVAIDDDDDVANMGDAISPLDGKGYDHFPYEEVFDRLDGTISNESDKIGVALSLIIRFLVRRERPLKGSHLAAIVGVRTIALAWSLNPSIFGGISLLKLSQELGINYRVLKWHSQAALKFTKTPHRCSKPKMRP